MVNGRLAAPAWRTAGQVGLAVAIGIEQLGNIGIFQLFNVGDVVFIGGFLVDQIPLCRPVDVNPFTVKFGVTACGLVLIGVQRIPVNRQEGRVAGGDGSVGDVVVHFPGVFNVIAQLFQRLADQQRLEGLF
ncbi:hypothetical protein D3C78_1632500 [compost metagenome]